MTKMPSTVFTKQQLLDELSKMLVAEAQAMNNIYFDNASKQLFGVEAKSNTEKLDLSRITIAQHFSFLYDFVMTGEWDLMGGLLHPEDLLADMEFFIGRYKAGYGYDTMGLGVEPTFCEYIARTSAARIKLDNFDDACHELTIPEVAAIAQMSEGSVWNATSKNTSNRLRTLKGSDSSTRVSIDDALAWLETKRSYQPSRYFDSVSEVNPESFTFMNELSDYLLKRCFEQGVSHKTYKDAVGWFPDRFKESKGLDVGDMTVFRLEEWLAVAEVLDVEPYWLVSRVLKILMVIFLPVGFVRNIIFELRQQYQAKTIEETCLVPVARDGSFFHPGLRLSKGFQIGKRGNDQQYVDTFEEALEKLQKMDKPRWRRPSATSGLFGTVTGVSWREVSLAELDSVEGMPSQGASS